MRSQSTPVDYQDDSIVIRFWKLIRGLLGGWTQKISAAVLDQGFFAGSNFVLNVLLARWMTPDQYGAFVVAYSWFLLPQNLYEAIIIEPMTILGSGKYMKSFRPYLGFVYRGHILVSLVFAVLLGVGAMLAYFFDTSLVSMALASAAIATPLLLTRWLTRYPFYVTSQPQWSALGGFIYFVLAGLLVFGLHEIAWLNAFTAILAMAVSGFISSTVLTIFLIKPIWRTQSEELTMAEVFREHRDYGKWAAPSRLISWAPSNVYYIVLPMLIGLSASGALRAMMNIVMPMLMAITAITAILIPNFVRTYERHGKAALDQRLRKVILLSIGITGLYCVAVTMFGKAAVNLLYDGQFDEYATIPILLTMGLLPIVALLNSVLDAALRSMGHVKLTFYARIIPAILTVTLGIALLAVWGILGANIATLITTTVGIVWMLRAYLTLEEPDKTTDEPDTIQLAGDSNS